MENRFPEFLQPTIERALQRTFQEHGGGSGLKAMAAIARICSRAGPAFMHEFRVNFSNTRF
jgi:hypothetical protein